jgi:hypothetical protein
MNPTRIVCYGLGNFACSPEKIKASQRRLDAMFWRNPRSESVLDQHAHLRLTRSKLQLDFLASLMQTHKVPTFIYDPCFVDDENAHLSSMGMHVLSTNLSEYVDRTLYYLPFCPRHVTDQIWRGHSVGHTIEIIGNRTKFVIPDVLCRVIRSACTDSDRKLFRQHYIVTKPTLVHESVRNKDEQRHVPEEVSSGRGQSQ